MTHILLKCALMGAAVILGSIGVQAAWVYDSTAGTLSDGNYSFPVKVVSLADPASAAGEKISGLEISGDATAGSGDLDFTSVETDTGYKVISIVYWDHAKILKNVTDCTRFIAPDLMQLGRASFQGYTALTEIVVSDKLTEIPYYCLNGTTGLKKITPETFPYVTKVGQGAIGSSAIETISFPNVTTIEREAFRSSKVTGDLSFPLLETAGDNAFLSATKITSVSAPKLNQTSLSLFAYCSELTNLVLGAGCRTGLASQSYANCPKLENITPAPVITSTSANPFVAETDTAYFKNNPFVMEGDAITSLDSCFMRQIPSLKYIEIKCSQITSIGSYVFAAIANDAEIRWEGPAPTTIHNFAFGSSTSPRKRLIVSGGEANIESWKAATYFNELTSAQKTSEDYLAAKKLGRVVGTIGTYGYLWLIDGRAGLCIRIQ